MSIESDNLIQHPSTTPREYLEVFKIEEIPPKRQNIRNRRLKIIGGVVAVLLISIGVGFYVNNKVQKFSLTPKTVPSEYSSDPMPSPVQKGRAKEIPLKKDNKIHDAKKEDIASAKFEEIDEINLEDTNEQFEYENYDEIKDYTTPNNRPPSPFESHSGINNFPNISNCGLQGPMTKMQHGDKAKLFEFSWMVAMQALNKTSKDEVYFCGGSLLSEKIVLTAAHCIVMEPDIEVSILLGEYNTSTDPDCEVLTDGSKLCAEKVQRFNSSDFTAIIHPDYNGETGLNDIALIHLKRPAVFNSAVNPICLPFFDDKLPNRTFVVGFGKTEKFWRPYSEVLMKVRINIIENEDCNEMIEGITNRTVADSQFCAYETIERKYRGKLQNTTLDTCKGDSGSPAMFPSTHSFMNGQYVQHGIVSWGFSAECGNSKPPGVYVRVHSYLEWILNNSFAQEAITSRGEISSGKRLVVNSIWMFLIILNAFSF